MMIIFLLAILLMSQNANAINENYLRSYAALTSNYNSVVTSKVNGYVHKRRCMRDYVTVTGEDPLLHNGETRDIHLKEYTNRRWRAKDPSGKSKTIILMPPVGGVTVIDNIYANYWCVHYPFKIIIIKKWPGYISMELDAYSHDLQIVDAIAAIRHVIEYTGEEKIGIIGNSLGAIYSSLAMGVDDRIKAGIFIVGGGDLPEIIGRSYVSRLVYLRNKRKKEFGFKTTNDYIDYLRKNIKIDPMHFINVLRNKKTFFISDIRDNDVPTKNQFIFRDAIEPNEYSQFKLGHTGAVIWTSMWFKQTFAGFFLRSL